MDTTAPSQGCRWGRSAEGAKRPTATSGASIPAGSTKKPQYIDFCWIELSIFCPKLLIPILYRFYFLAFFPTKVKIKLTFEFVIIKHKLIPISIKEHIARCEAFIHDFTIYYFYLALVIHFDSVVYSAYSVYITLPWKFFARYHTHKAIIINKPSLLMYFTINIVLQRKPSYIRSAKDRAYIVTYKKSL